MNDGGAGIYNPAFERLPPAGDVLGSGYFQSFKYFNTVFDHLRKYEFIFARPRFDECYKRIETFREQGVNLK